MAIYHHTTRMIGRSNGGSPVKALAYISGVQLTDQRTGEVWNFQDKSVQDVQLLLPENAPLWAKELKALVEEDREKAIQILSDLANHAEKRVDAQVYREVEFSLPRELSYDQNKALATEYVQDQFCGLGMMAVQSFHLETVEKTGEDNLHCHTFFLTRELAGQDLSLRDLSQKGSPQVDLSRDLLSEKKNRDWNTREVHEVWREQWAQYASFHLKMHGHDITLDHRSYKDQGLDIEPQIKLGKGVIEQEKRRELPSHGLGGASQGFVDSIPATERGQEFRLLRLRNLYRIMRRPETVFDIVTRHHTTFMWGDVQKILGRYIDDPVLFQRLDARLQNSKELILLKPDGLIPEKPISERLTSGGLVPERLASEKLVSERLALEGLVPERLVSERAIYTTRNLLKAEKALVSTAESLAGKKTHQISSASLEGGLERLNARLQNDGYSLSEGQELAIRHLVGEGQLKCLVGYAGAGKTTALRACRGIWEEEGYKVYGLAPTGRAAQNLEGSGISSQTLHKFLKSFEEGRSQYSSKSILVLDEAGMVDVERLERFLSAVQRLGVKAVVVGDGAQLQPVEAGPSFRLVTERLTSERLVSERLTSEKLVSERIASKNSASDLVSGRLSSEIHVARLEEIVRQKESWQKDATVLFGKQESQKAIQAYQARGHIHLVEERLPLGSLPLANLPTEKRPFDHSANVQSENGHLTDSHLAVAHPQDAVHLQDVVRGYEMAARTSGLIYREIMKDIKEQTSKRHIPEGSTAPSPSSLVSSHEDYSTFLHWRGVQKEAGKEILGNPDIYKPILESRSLDPLEMARLFVNKKQDKTAQYNEASEILKEKGLSSLIGTERPPGQTVEVRSDAKEALIEGWKVAFQEDSSKSLLMMAYSNRDVQDLNRQARTRLKSLGVLDKQEFTYTVHREREDDFGHNRIFKEARDFSKGDRIVFTRNNYGLGIKNGTIGTITEINAQKIQVSLGNSSRKDSSRGGEKDVSDKTGDIVSFAPKLNPYFDQGWAITIHKSQGTTVDKSFLLASHEMTQNLTYVAMTRHREDVQVYGSTLDFWRAEKVPDILSKSGEKLGAGDYLDANSLNALMKDEDRFLERLFTKLGDELQAMGTVTKHAFKEVVDHFLGRSSEKEKILLKPATMLTTDREEARAQTLLQKTGGAPYSQAPPSPPLFSGEKTRKGGSPRRDLSPASAPAIETSAPHQAPTITTLKDVYEDWKHPAFKDADFYKGVFEKGVNVLGEAASVQYWLSKREPYLDLYTQRIEQVEKELKSPLLSYMSDESRALTRQNAALDPEKTLTFLSTVIEGKREEQRREQISQARAAKALQEKEAVLKAQHVQEQERQTRFKQSWSQYYQFKELSHSLSKRNVHDLDREERTQLAKERYALGKSLYENKEIFSHIEKVDADIAKSIKKIAEEQHIQRIKDLDRDMGRGGFSL